MGVPPAQIKHSPVKNDYHEQKILFRQYRIGARRCRNSYFYSLRLCHGEEKRRWYAARLSVVCVSRCDRSKTRGNNETVGRVWLPKRGMVQSKGIPGGFRSTRQI